MSPDYYAAGIVRHNYEVGGHGLLSIPWDAVGLLANDNDAPLYFRDRLDPNFYTVLVDRSDERLNFVQSVIHDYGTPFYLGAIVSSDRQTLYWVNRSRPLPV